MFYDDYTVFDIETDGLLDEVSMIHCLCAKRYFPDRTSLIYKLTDPTEIKNFLETQVVLVGHNIKLYDLPVARKLLNANITAKIVDTLPLSWYLYPQYKDHGLEEWGNRLGVAKPQIADWKNLTIEEYLNRCMKDIEINAKLLHKEITYLSKIYEGQDIKRPIGYFNFKMDCAEEQQQQRCRINVPALLDLQIVLAAEKEKRVADLILAMPPKLTYEDKTRPKVMFKQDKKSPTGRSISANGQKWFDLLKEHGLPEDAETCRVLKKTEPGSPSSYPQLKSWLFSLGWEPTLFDYKRNKDTGEVRAIPQISDDDGEICPNIELLIEKEPALVNLKGLTIVNHRIGVVKSFLENTNENGYTTAEVGGLTNTLRFKHRKPIANLPKIVKPYGKEIRGAIIPPEGMILCGSDMSSLEDSTKQHFMYPHDPEYVKEMQQPGFDPHLSIAVFAEMMTEAQAEFFKWFKKQEPQIDPNPAVEGLNYHPMSLDELKSLPYNNQKALYIFLGEQRGDAKVVNFSAVYGVGAPRMSMGTGWPIPKCQFLIKAYWGKNWSVKVIAAETYHKVVDGQMWLWNPVSELWYSLRYEKDKFSTLNQGTGVYCFDTWVRRVRSKGIKITLQYHDEIAFILFENEKEDVKAKLLEAIKEANEELKLNITLGISVDFGLTYAEIH